MFKKNFALNWTIAFAIFLILYLGITYLSNKPVYICSYQVSELLTIESSNIGTANMKQIITFIDEDGNTIILDNVLYNGSSTPDTLYVWRIGQWSWVSKLKNGYTYYVSDKY